MKYQIYYGIDGTDNRDSMSFSATPGEVSLVTSYVKRICAMGFDRFHYMGGTTNALTGRGTKKLADSAVEWVVRQKQELTRSNSSVSVFLGGFSRGGASTIIAAHELADRGIDVRAMFLFDAVDRTANPNYITGVIPKNVEQSFHAIRHPFAKSRDLPLIGFGNCGLKSKAGNLMLEAFYTTHGGVGGWRLGSERLVAIESDFKNAHYRERFSPKRTEVTPIQQLSGSLAAWNWMYKNVADVTQL